MLTCYSFGIPEKLVTLLQNLCAQSQLAINIGATLGEWFTPELGTRHWPDLSTVIYFATWACHGATTATECNTAANGVNVHGVIIKDLRFADDVDLLAEEEVDQLHTNSKEYGLQINTNKSKVMVFERRSYRHPTITFDTGVLECVPEFVYLGSLVTKDNDCSAEINCRINLASQRLWMLKMFWSSSELTIRTKIDLLVACVFSHLLYAAETWTINAADSRKLLVFEMRCGNWQQHCPR